MFHVRKSFDSSKRGQSIVYLFPLEAEMTLLEINQIKVNVGEARIYIKEICAIGMRFLSPVKLPSIIGLVLGINTTIRGRPVRCTGKVAGGCRMRGDHYEYRLVFDHA